MAFFIFSSMTIAAAQMQRTGFPKWDGLIDLQDSGLPIPKGVFVKPYSQIDEIESTVNDFMSQNVFCLIALRPDGKNGIGKTPPGISFEKTEKGKIVNKLVEWSGIGYGVTLVETHSRFDYDFCCNVLLLDEDGNFVIEFVGPGFDGGDLNKAILKPSVIVSNKAESPIFIYSDFLSKEANIETLERIYFRVNISRRAPTEEEINTRLEYIMERLLPDMGIDIEKNLTATKEWLEKNGCNRLFRRETAGSFISLKDVQDIIYSTSLYAHELLRSGKKISNHALTAHKFNNKIVFFGTYNSQKWGRGK